VRSADRAILDWECSARYPKQRVHCKRFDVRLGTLALRMKPGQVASTMQKPLTDSQAQS
jgi:hypothetical protein